MLLPKIAEAMTEHSICHPGRPGPHGDGHEGSPGFEAFQSAKSAGDRRPVATERAPTKKVKLNIGQFGPSLFRPNMEVGNPMKGGLSECAAQHKV